MYTFVTYYEMNYITRNQIGYIKRKCNTLERNSPCSTPNAVFAWLTPRLPRAPSPAAAEGLVSRYCLSPYCVYNGTGYVTNYVNVPSK